MQFRDSEMLAVLHSRLAQLKVRRACQRLIDGWDRVLHLQKCSSNCFGTLIQVNRFGKHPIIFHVFPSNQNSMNERADSRFFQRRTLVAMQFGSWLLIIPNSIRKLRCFTGNTACKTILGRHWVYGALPPGTAVKFPILRSDLHR